MDSNLPIHVAGLRIQDDILRAAAAREARAAKCETRRAREPVKPRRRSLGLRAPAPKAASLGPQ